MKANGETGEKLGQSARISSPVPPGQGGKGSYSGRQTSTRGGRAQQSRDFLACQGLWADLLLMRQTAAVLLPSCACAKRCTGIWKATNLHLIKCCTYDGLVLPLLHQEISFLIITQLLFFNLKMGCGHYVGLLLPFPF